MKLALSIFLVPPSMVWRGLSLVQIQSHTFTASLSLPFVFPLKKFPTPCLHHPFYASQFAYMHLCPAKLSLSISGDFFLSLCSLYSWYSKCSDLNTAVFEGGGKFQSPYFSTILTSLLLSLYKYLYGLHTLPLFFCVFLPLIAT